MTITQLTDDSPCGPYHLFIVVVTILMSFFLHFLHALYYPLNLQYLKILKNKNCIQYDSIK